MEIQFRPQNGIFSRLPKSRSAFFATFRTLVIENPRERGVDSKVKDGKVAHLKHIGRNKDFKLMKLILIFSFFISFLWSCNKGKIEKPLYSVVQIDSISRVHLGRGYYRIFAYYDLIYEGKIVQCKSEYRTVRSYNSNIAIEDSVLLVYDKHDITKCKVLKVVYKKEKIKL
jgi:hypothetical protein